MYWVFFCCCLCCFGMSDALLPAAVAELAWSLSGGLSLLLGPHAAMGLLLLTPLMSVPTAQGAGVNSILL
jgi:hypothetical protein